MNLNLGGGSQRIDGFQNVDLSPGADYMHDLGCFPWPFADGSADALIASHILEHFTKAEGRAFLRQCYRILKPGGFLAIAVPDMDRFIDAKLTGNYTPLEGYYWTDLNHLLGGDSREPNAFMRHRYMYTWESLAWTLQETGFDPRPVFFDTSALGDVHNPEYAPISLYVDARKG